MTETKPVLHLEVSNLEDFNAAIEKANVQKPEELKMRGQLPATQTEMIEHAKFYGLRVIEETTLPKGVVLLKDAHGHILRQFRLL